MADATFSKTSTGGTLKGNYSTYQLHAKVYVERTDSNTSSSVKVYCYAVPQSSGVASSFLKGQVTNNSAGTSWTTAVNTNVPTGGSQIKMTETTFSVTRTTSEQTITCKAYLFCNSGGGMYEGQNDTASVPVTIPALTSYSIKYYGNAPSGTASNVPSSQTKYYGTNLTLRSTSPTLTNYIFKGWATSSTSTIISYNPGDTYKGNNNLNLYAIWELAYTNPSITNLSVQRCMQDHTLSEDGTYCVCNFNWILDSTATSANLIVKYKDLSTNNNYSPDSTVSPSTLSGTSGSSTIYFGNNNYDTTKSYSIQIIITDNNNHSQEYQTTLGQSFITLSANPNHGIGIGKTVTASNLFDIGINTNIDGTLTVNNISPLEGVEIIGTVLDDNDNEVLLAFRFGPIIMIQIRGVVASTGTTIAEGICANYKPKQNASTILGTSGSASSGNNTSDGKNHYCRGWVSAQNGNVSLEYIDYSGSGKWYGTLTYILDTANASLS